MQAGRLSVPALGCFKHVLAGMLVPMTGRTQCWLRQRPANGGCETRCHLGRMRVWCLAFPNTGQRLCE